MGNRRNPVDMGNPSVAVDEIAMTWGMSLK